MWVINKDRLSDVSTGGPRVKCITVRRFRAGTLCGLSSLYSRAILEGVAVLNVIGLVYIQV